jgi:hypothetical protein
MICSNKSKKGFHAVYQDVKKFMIYISIFTTNELYSDLIIDVGLTY